MKYFLFQVIQSFSKCVFGVTGDMDVIRVLFFMMENFPAYFKVTLEIIFQLNVLHILMFVVLFEANFLLLRQNPEGLQYQVEQRVIFLKNCRGNEV